MINTNLASLVSQQHQRQANDGLKTALERLSSGLRINSAKDDAAGQVIANRMEANLRAGDQISRGLNDGISLMQTAEGGLDSINNLLQRSRELAVQAANGTLSDTDRTSINAEYKELRAEIDRIATSTEAFSKHPLAPADIPAASPTESVPSALVSLADKFGESGTTLTGERSGVKFVSFIPKGATDITIETDGMTGAEDDIQLFDQQGVHIAGTPVEGSDGDYTWSENGVITGEDVKSHLFEASSDIPSDASYSESDDPAFYAPSPGEAFDGSYKVVKNHEGMTISYTGDGDRFDSDTNKASDGSIGNGSTDAVHTVERLHIDKAEKTLFVAVTGTGSYNITATWGSMPGESPTSPSEPPTSEGIDIVTSANYGQEIKKVTIPPSPADHVSLGLEDVELDPIEKAREALGKLQEAMNQVDDYRGKYGALHNRFDSAIENLGEQKVSASAAQSRILDADYAEETSNMVKAQILQQASTSMLAQANQTPFSVLGLLSPSGS